MVVAYEAKKFVVEAVPLTSNVKLGDIVFTPTLPELRTVKSDDEAFEIKFASIGSVDVPHTEKVEYGVVVPTDTRAFLIPPPPSDSP